MLNRWNMYNSCCQRAVQCNLQVWEPLWAFWYLIFGGHKVILIDWWFFLDSYYRYQCQNLVCLERECAAVHSLCVVLVWMRMSCSSRQVHPNGHAGAWSPIFSAPELLNAMYIVQNWSIGGICTCSLVHEDSSCACPFELPHATEGRLLRLLVPLSCLFMPWHSVSCSMICRYGGYMPLLCGMKEFAPEAVCWSIRMSGLGGSNWWVAACRPHFLFW